MTAPNTFTPKLRRLIAVAPQLCDSGHRLAMLALQSDFYQKPDVKAAVDSLLAVLTHIEGKEKR